MNKPKLKDYTICACPIPETLHPLRPAGTRRLLPRAICGKLAQLLLCRREAGGELQRFLKVRARFPATAAADEGEPEIEEIPIIRAVARNRRAEGLFRFVQMSGAAQRHAERVPRRRTGRVDRNRLTKAGERRVDMPEIALHLAQPLPDHGVFGQNRERAVEGAPSLIRPPRPKAH